MSETTAEPTVVLQSVRKEFGSYVAVEHADFAIRAGEFFSLLGPSGCGKTTLLKMIAGFEQPSAGAVLLEGVDVSSVPTGAVVVVAMDLLLLSPPQSSSAQPGRLTPVCRIGYALLRDGTVRA